MSGFATVGHVEQVHVGAKDAEPIFFERAQNLPGGDIVHNGA